MRIVKRRIWWEPVPVVDLVNYRIYWALTPTPFGYELPAIEAPKEVTEVVAPTDFPEGTFEVDGDYNIWVTAVDEVGNESDPLALSGRFDFTPPPAPLSGGIESF